MPRYNIVDGRPHGSTSAGDAEDCALEGCETRREGRASIGRVPSWQQPLTLSHLLAVGGYGAEHVEGWLCIPAGVGIAPPGVGGYQVDLPRGRRGRAVVT